jgi:hypothetical protein
LENWVDLFGFVPRQQLAKLLLQVGDYQFSTILQYVLNEVGQITLGNLHILVPKEDGANGPIVKVPKQIGWHIQQANLLDVPMPKNITHFKAIQLR